MKLIEKFTYGFEDVSLEPHPFSRIDSRLDVDTTTTLKARGKSIVLQTPIIASPMADVCDNKVAIAIAKAGGIGCIHRFQSIDEQCAMIHNVYMDGRECLAAVGTTDDAFERAKACVDAGAFGIIVDVAFLNERTLNVCSKIREAFPDIYLISGNVATGAGFRMGVERGLNAIRVGIGNGQACRTSRVTGIGIGLVTSLMECYEESMTSNVKVICDGGMDTGGSFCKALAAGASLALMGRSFAGTWEAPGRIFARTTDFAGGTLSHIPGMAFPPPEMVEKIKEDGHPIYKEYRGSASMEAQMVYKARGRIVTSEGVASLVQVFGSVADVLGRFNGALRSSMSYLGASSLDIFRERAVFRLVSQGVFSQQKARGLQSYEITI